MSLKDKLNLIKGCITSTVPTKKELPTTYTEAELAHLDEMDSELDLLLKEDEKGSLVKTKTNLVKEVIRLIILLDISGSMCGTEDDVYLGLKDLIDKHKKDNILLNFIAFNDDRYELLDDVIIGAADVVKIEPIGGTNLNGTLYHALLEKCSTGINLLVTISDGADTENKVATTAVREQLKSNKNSHNHFYFIGEPNKWQQPEDVQKNASELGFDMEHIAVFTREGNGNRLNFAVISSMLDELIYNGKISSTWSKPIKEHYLALTDKKRR